MVGKGAAYAEAEEQVKLFIEKTGLPFLPTPMGNDTLLLFYYWMFLKIAILKLMNNNLMSRKKLRRIIFFGISKMTAHETPSFTNYLEWPHAVVISTLSPN